jgi:hypothetical protein
VSTRGDLQFEITQGYRNLAVLHYVRELLGIGRVNKQGSRTFRYVIQDMVGLREIIHLLNGEMVLKKRHEGIRRMIEAYNLRYGAALEYKESQRKVTLKDGWLSGFTDGEGSFTIGYIRTKGKFQIRYIVSQKEDLGNLKAEIGGMLYHNKTTDHYDLIFRDMEGSTGKNTE